MKRNIITTILTIGFLTLCAAVSANAQTNFVGKYVYEAKIADEENPGDYESLFEITIELKGKNQAVFTKTKSEVVEIEKPGSWTWNKAKTLLTITFPAAKNAAGEEYKKVILTFKSDGKDLKVVKVSPVSAGKVGDVFKKI